MGEGPEYETIALGGANCGIDDIDALMKFNRSATSGASTPSPRAP